MSAAVEAEIVPPERDQDPGPKGRLQRVRMLGFLGTILALLTTLVAFSFGFLALFGATLVSALLIWLLWPLIFSPQFTQWVFGAERAPFWKLFLLFLAAGAVLKLFRRNAWPRR